MSQPGAVVGRCMVRALVTVNLGLTNAIVIIAAGGVLLSGLIMMFARPVITPTKVVDIEISSVKNTNLIPRT